ncbi:MAG TPA: hypothetical protein VIJ84_02675 [Gaiellaceae bacterium]
MTDDRAAIERVGGQNGIALIYLPKTICAVLVSEGENGFGAG